MKNEKIKLLTIFFRMIHNHFDLTLDNTINLDFEQFHSVLSDDEINKCISLANSISGQYNFNIEEDVSETDSDFHFDGATKLVPSVFIKINSDLLYTKLLEDYGIIEQSEKKDNQKIYYLSNGFVADLKQRKYFYNKKQLSFNLAKQHTQLFFAIIQSKNGILTYDEIIELFWSNNDNGYGADDIRKIKQSLNKDFRDLGMTQNEYNAMIRTESKQGYRVLVEVEEK